MFEEDGPSFVETADEAPAKVDVGDEVSIKAVSYTHLDVYKRQGMECGVGISNFTDIKVGDTVEAFVTEKMAAELTAS